MQVVQLRLFVGLVLCLMIPSAAMWDPRYEQAGSLNTKDIKQVLEKQIFGMSINKKALDAFLQQDSAIFDPAVGDNLCQVRAHAIAALSSRSASANEEIIEAGNNLSKIHEQLRLIAHEISPMLLRKASQNILGEELKSSTLSAFLNKRGCEVPVFADDMRGLMLSYFLTLFCHYDKKRGQELLNELMKQSGLKKKAATELIHWARVELNAYSLRYLQRTSDQLLNDLSQNNKTDEVMHELCRARLLQQGLMQQVKSKLWTTPSVFIGMAVLLKNILLSNMPVALCVKTMCSQGAHDDVLMCIAQDNHFIWQHNDDKMMGTVFVVKGVSSPTDRTCDNLEFDALEKHLDSLKSHQDSECDQRKAALQAMLGLDLNDIILANCAMHRQFLDPQVAINFSSIKELEPEYEMFKTKALELGLCKENMRCFRILHIFPAKLNEIKK